MYKTTTHPDLKINKKKKQKPRRSQALSYGPSHWIQVLALEAAHPGGSFEAMLHTNKFKENSSSSHSTREGKMRLFRSFRLDSANQCLWRGEHRGPPTPKAFDWLRYLGEHSWR